MCVCCSGIYVVRVLLMLVVIIWLVVGWCLSRCSRLKLVWKVFRCNCRVCCGLVCW